MKTNCFDRLHYFLHFLFLKLTISLFGPMSLCRTEGMGSSAQRKGWPEPGAWSYIPSSGGKAAFVGTDAGRWVHAMGGTCHSLLTESRTLPQNYFLLFYFKFVLK